MDGKRDNMEIDKTKYYIYKGTLIYRIKNYDNNKNEVTLELVDFTKNEKKLYDNVYNFPDEFNGRKLRRSLEWISLNYFKKAFKIYNPEKDNHKVKVYKGKIFCNGCHSRMYVGEVATKICGEYFCYRCCSSIPLMQRYKLLKGITKEDLDSQETSMEYEFDITTSNVEESKQITLEEFLKSKELLAIHCNAEKQINKLIKELNETSKVCFMEVAYSMGNEFSKHKENICFLNKNPYYANVAYCKHQKIKIYEFKDIFLGDVLKSTDLGDIKWKD